MAPGGGIAGTVWREARSHPARSLALIALAALIGASNLAIPIYLEQALDAAAGVTPFDLLWPALGLLAAIGLGRGLVSWLRDTLLRRLRMRRIAELDRALVATAFRAERGALEPVGPGGAADAVASGDRIGAWLFGELPGVLAEAATGLALLVLLWSYDWRMGVLGLALAASNGVAIWRLAGREAALGAARARAEDQLARRLESGLAALDAIRIAGLQPVALAGWDRALDRRSAELDAALARGEAAAARQMAVSAVAQALVLGIGGGLIAVVPGFTIGDLFACAALVFALNDPARRLMMAHAEISKAAGEILRRTALRRLTPMATAGAPPDRFERARVRGAGEADWKRLAAARPGCVLLTAPTEIVAGTLTQNVTLMAPADSARLFRALRLACLEDEFLARGLDTRLRPGISDLSTGQRQRLGIARALYADAPAILLAGGLDHLDRDTAGRLLSGLDREGPGLLVADGPVTEQALAHWPVIAP